MQGIFFDGQVFDAYQFASDLVRAAKRHIILIDNYVDDTVLTLLDKRAAEASATIFTRHVSAQLQLDLDKKWFSFGKMEIDAGELLSHLQNII
ncbi:MAG: hypothetical protein K5636_07950 [Bacteroidales bacterium]|nr:hypothetical protein [Bacteroidales bacterium]